MLHFPIFMQPHLIGHKEQGDLTSLLPVHYKGMFSEHCAALLFYTVWETLTTKWWDIDQPQRKHIQKQC